jgi:hypothetical protein
MGIYRAVPWHKPAVLRSQGKALCLLSYDAPGKTGVSSRKSSFLLLLIFQPYITRLHQANNFVKYLIVFNVGTALFYGKIYPFQKQTAWIHCLHTETMDFKTI